MIPIFLVQRYHLEGQAVTPRDEGTHLDVLLGTAITLVIVHADADVEQVQVLALLLEPVNHHGAINASRNQYCCTHAIFSFTFSLKTRQDITPTPIVNIQYHRPRHGR